MSGGDSRGGPPPDRRTLLKAGAAGLLGAGALLAFPALLRAAPEAVMTDALWKEWQADWRWMEAIARRRQWQLTPLAIAPPARALDVRLMELRHGVKVPPQLRTLLTRYSARVSFGWHIPSHLHPLDHQRLPTSSANRNAVWDMAHMDQDAIPNFFGWKKQLAARDRSEAPNTPEMWEHQFPFYGLVNGDMLTIDMSKPEGPHPVRYFSHELETLHGMALAPDFLTFISEMSKLGMGGTEWASFGPFGSWDEPNQTFYLRADSAGGKAWRDWLEQDPAKVAADEPPLAIIAETPAERALLTAAMADSLPGVAAALAAGARPDVVWNGQWMLENQGWDEEFATALTFAVRHSNIPLLELLLEKGATLDTRRLPMAEAAKAGSLRTIEWLIARGARVNGWKDDRYWPLHNLIVTRARFIAPTRAELETRLAKEEGWDDATNRSPGMQKILRRQLDGHVTRDDYLAMVAAVLKAGADPDARWDNGTTMLMWAGVADGELLLKAGADVMARESDGDTPLHRATSPEKIRLLVAHGAKLDDLPPKDYVGESGDGRSTPLQTAVLLGRLIGGHARARTLLELGADARVRDGRGRSTLAYCTTIEGFEMIAAKGLDPKEPMPDGGTLLHNLFRTTSVRATFPEEVGYFDFLIRQGLDVNARDASGQTLLHVAVESTDTLADIALLLERGVDKTIRDKAGRRAVDLVPKSETDIRKLLG
ncbi:hypothetical protein GCM10007301_38350 [Azorhizobium oxalatiphilum]|uniref:Ankyrin repeat protein n=1 Tax=Azorhizobium oxalatiphilum TaxID=980631 RepID=A0A917FE57_9HYPH|nr:hypothetical protein [Azorhizobium oxalatiphilum]GGF74810.1 hypothetical protein GCM10007301_38350 [Azorhizobium oxalatiphilum]